MVDKLTRKQAKEQTRQKLLDALLQIARTDGLQALTTTRIAAAAGGAQSSFYFHFDGMDEAMRAAADKLGRGIRDTIRRERGNIDLSDPKRTVRSVHAVTINAFLADPAFAQLFLQHRRDTTTPLGQTFAELLDETRRELASDMARVMAALPNPDVYAELFIGMSLAIVEGLLDGRLADRDACLDAMAHVVGTALAHRPSTNAD